VVGGDLVESRVARCGFAVFSDGHLTTRGRSPRCRRRRMSRKTIVVDRWCRLIGPIVQRG
jgi:hypothetical protein